jgi:hypothetical protein
MITIRVEDAYLTHDTDLLDRMVLSPFIQDPYVVIHYGGQRQQTSVQNNGGKNPRWGESFTFPRTGDTMVRL